MKPEPPNWILSAALGARSLGRFTLPVGAVQILGRDDSLPITLAERSVSRRHAEVQVAADHLLLVDLGSQNGLFRDGERHERLELRPGERLFVGDVLLSCEPAGEDKPSRGGAAAPASLKVPGKAPSSATPSVATLGYGGVDRDRLATLIDISMSLAGEHDLDRLLDRVLDHLSELITVQRVVIVLVEADDAQQERLVVRRARPEAAGSEVSNFASESILWDVIRTGEARRIDDAKLQRSFKEAQSVLISDIRAAVCAPLRGRGGTLGAIYADFPGRAALYREDDLGLLSAFAAIAGVALENAHMTVRLREQDRLQRDLELAAELQRGLLPDLEAQSLPLDVGSLYLPSRQVGGDFFDVQVDAQGCIALTIGDVCGKGIGAALLMTRIVTAMRATAVHEATPDRVFSEVNAGLESSDERVMYATAQRFHWNAESATLRFVNAGHLAAVLLPQGEADAVELHAPGLPLGVDASYRYREQVVPCEAGTLVVLCTDGVTERRNAEGVEFGRGRWTEFLAQHRALHPRELISRLHRHLDFWGAKAGPAGDDVAVLAFRLPTGSEER